MRSWGHCIGERDNLIPYNKKCLSLGCLRSRHQDMIRCVRDLRCRVGAVVKDEEEGARESEKMLHNSVEV